MIRLSRELGLETFPTYNEGENLLRFGDDPGPVPRRDPEDQPADARGHGARPRPGSTAWPARCRSRRRGPRRAPRRWDSMTFETWIVRERAHREGAQPAAPLLRGGVRRRAAGLLAAPRALLHALRWGSRCAGRRARTARSRTATSVARSWCRSRMAEELGDDVVRLRAPVRRIEQRGDVVTVLADGRARHRAACDRRDPAGARRSHRLRPAAARATGTSSPSGCPPGRSSSATSSTTRRSGGPTG